MTHDERQPEPLDIEVFLPKSVEVIDSRDGTRTTVAPRRRRRGTRKWLILFLFVATCASTFFVGMTPGDGPRVYELWRDGQLNTVSDAQWTAYLRDGVTFSCAVMLILFAHEMGHYLQSRRYGVPATPPFFIPMPITPFGTMGAVIFQEPGVADRKALFDIAVSGPLAGLIFALPITYFGLLESNVIGFRPVAEEIVYAAPPIMRWMIDFVHPQLAANEMLEDTPLLFAGWVGIFITALNLIPIGQLDGGHILYTLIGKRAHRVALLLLWGGIAYMFFSGNYSYILIFVLLMFFGPRHPPTADDRVPLGITRTVLGWLTLCFIFVGFTPQPIMMLKPQPAPKHRLEQLDEQKQRKRPAFDPELTVEFVAPPPSRLPNLRRFAS